MKIFLCVMLIAYTFCLVGASCRLMRSKEIKHDTVRIFYIQHDTIRAAGFGMYQNLRVHDTVIQYRTKTTNINKVDNLIIGQ